MARRSLGGHGFRPGFRLLQIAAWDLAFFALGRWRCQPLLAWHRPARHPSFVPPRSPGVGRTQGLPQTTGRQGPHRRAWSLRRRTRSREHGAPLPLPSSTCLIWSWVRPVPSAPHAFLRPAFTGLGVHCSALVWSCRRLAVLVDERCLLPRGTRAAPTGRCCGRWAGFGGLAPERSAACPRRTARGGGDAAGCELRSSMVVAGGR